MAVTTTTAILIGAAAGVAGTVYNASQQRKAAKENEKANERAQRIEATRAQRERAQAIRQQRIANASVIASGAASGTLSSSGTQGALASYNTQTAGNISFTEQLNQLNAQRMQFLENAAQYQDRGQMGMAIGSIINSGTDAYAAYKKG